MEEHIHRDPNAPHICGHTGVAFAACKLMFWPSKARRACGEVGNIVIFPVSNSGEIDNFDLIADVGRFLAKNIIHFNVPIGDPLVMHVLHSFADL